MTGINAISYDGREEFTIEPEQDAVLTALRQTIDEPTLTHARALESVLRRVGMPAKVFGRLNQKSSIDAAAESDRGITERLANAFDASVTAARRLSGMNSSDASLTPRNAAQRFLNPDRDSCDWRPVEKKLDCYQHCFRLDDVPEIVHEQVVTEPEDLKRAAEICLNYDKALRMAMLERKIVAKTR